MSNLNDLFRKTEAELAEKRKANSDKAERDAQSAQLLKDFAAEQWPVLMQALHDLTDAATLDGKRFFWSDKTVTLGDVQLSVWSGQFRFGRISHYPKREEPSKLYPIKTNEGFGWASDYTSFGTRNGTQQVAEALITELVTYYKGTQVR